MEEEPCIEKGIEKPVVSKARSVRNRMDGPDGGWAWVVTFSACIISFIIAGLARMSGILYVAFIETFKVDRKAASMPFSVSQSTRNLLGPIVGILGQKYGVRAVTITGGVLATVSGAACFFAHDIIWITIFWGVLNGIGTALTVTLPQVVIGQYFVKYATTASGLAFSGGCIGSFLFPVLLEQLLLFYGMQGTFLIIAAILMHTIPAAMILRKPPWLKNTKNCKKAGSRKILKSLKEKSSNMNGENDLFLQKGNPQKKDINKRWPEDFPDIQFLKQNRELVLNILTAHVPEENLYLEINRNESVPSSHIYINQLEDIYTSLQRWQFYENLKRSKVSLYCERLEVIKNDKPTQYHKSQSFQLGKSQNICKSDVTKTGSVSDVTDKKIQEFDQNSVLTKIKYIKDLKSDILSSSSQEKKAIQELYKLYNTYTTLRNFERKRAENNRNSVLRSAVSSLETITVKEEDLRSNSFITHIITAMNIYKKPLFLLICASRAVHFITVLPVLTAVVDFIMDKGLVEADGKYAIAAFSLGDLLGRLCFEWVTDRGYMSMQRYMLIMTVLQGICTASLAWMNTKFSLLTMLAVFGMFQGSLFVRHNVLVSQYFESHEQSIAMGCMNLFSGLLGFALPTYIGYFRDTIGSYDYILYINGAIGIIVGFLWALEPYFHHRVVGKNEPVPV